jgi:thermostable 8-oxoguanine DNA glycosylase
VLRETLRDAKVRWPNKKAEWLARDFERIVDMGGVTEAREALLGKIGQAAKIEFLQSFVGIGEKYARNIMMDVYHPDFRESVAIDARIRSVSSELGLSFDSYEEHEQFYLDVAHNAGLSGWELDRLIFNFRDEIVCRLEEATG